MKKLILLLILIFVVLLSNAQSKNTTTNINKASTNIDTLKSKTTFPTKPAQTDPDYFLFSPLSDFKSLYKLLKDPDDVSKNERLRLLSVLEKARMIVADSTSKPK